jgi:hypothetical protein
MLCLPDRPLDHLWVLRRGDQPVTKDNAIYSYAVRWSKKSRAEALQEAIASFPCYVPPPENRKRRITKNWKASYGTE